VVPILVVGGIGVLGRQQCAALIVVWVEGVVVGELGFVVVQAPHVEEYHRAFGEQFAVYPFVCMLSGESDVDIRHAYIGTV
jgi:hypothetical protein